MGAKCPDCGSTSIRPSLIAGLGTCKHCGKVFSAPGLRATPLVEAPDIEPVELENWTDSIPDSIECAIGWRAWDVKLPESPGEVPVLTSVSHTSASWTPGAPMVAQCDRQTGLPPDSKKRHESPGESCSCGLYAAKTLDHLLSLGNKYHRYDAEDGSVAVIGKVKLWGKVIEATQGWRAQCGYPETLYVPFEAWGLAARLRKEYGTPVYLKNILANEVY